jgi:hypothetical protein
MQSTSSSSSSSASSSYGCRREHWRQEEDELSRRIASVEFRPLRPKKSEVKKETESAFAERMKRRMRRILKMEGRNG